MRTWATILAVLLAAGLTGTADAGRKAGKAAQAQKGAKTHRHKHDALTGKILSIAPDGKSFTLQKGRKGGTTTVALDTTTQVLLKNARHAKAQPGTLAALQVGKHVAVKPAAGTASKIVVREFARKARAAGNHKMKGRGRGKNKAAA